MIFMYYSGYQICSSCEKRVVILSALEMEIKITIEMEIKSKIKIKSKKTRPGTFYITAW